MSGHDPYNLIDQPWLLARRRDGTVAQLSILDTLGSAHELVTLLGEVPTQVFALTQLLLAILHRALNGPADTSQWAQLWNAPSLPRERIEAYLRTHADRFDLFHPETPFFQVANLHTAKGETSELAKLIADMPNGSPFFTMRLDPSPTLSYAEAARWLVHCQAFDPSGIKSGAVGDTRVKGGKGYPIGIGWSGWLGGVLAEGDTLRETLLLNLIAADHLDPWPDNDRPAWERPPDGPGEQQQGGRPPTGPLDLYTWQSRRIRLFTTGGQVSSVLICNGEPLHPRNQQHHEPHTAWRRSQAQEKAQKLPLVYMPRSHDPSRSIWQGLAALLPGAPQQQGRETIAPTVLDWIARLTLEVLDPDRLIRLRTIGMEYGQQSAVTTDIVDDALHLHPVLLQPNRRELVAVAVTSAGAADQAAHTLGQLAENLARAAGGDPGGHHDRAYELALSELDFPYRAWIGGLASGTDPQTARQDWADQARRIVRRLGDKLIADAPPIAWTGHPARLGKREYPVFTVAHAEQLFRRGLWFALRPDNKEEQQ